MTEQAYSSTLLDNDLAKYRNFSDQELSDLVKVGNIDARWVLTGRIEGTIQKTVKYWTAKMLARGCISAEDLQQEARLAVYNAVGNWNPSLGVPLGAYVHQIVKNEILKQYAAASPVSIDPQTLREGAKLKALQEAFWEKNGRAPTIHELATMGGTSCRRASRLMGVASVPLSFEKNSEVDQNDAISSEQYAEVCKGYVDDITPLVSLERKDMLNHVRNAVAQLEPQKRALITGLFSLDNRPKITGHDLHESLGLTHWKAEQLKQAAFKELRKMLQPGIQKVPGVMN